MSLARRSDSQRQAAQLSVLHARVSVAESALLPLQHRVRQLEADAGAAAEEVRAARDEAARWESRATALMKKHDAVDVAEYQRVTVQLHVRVVVHLVCSSLIVNDPCW